MMPTLIKWQARHRGQVQATYIDKIVRINRGCANSGLSTECGSWAE